MKMDCILKNSASSSAVYPSSGQNQKMCHGLQSSCQKFIDVFLVRNFKATFSARVMVRKTDFCTVLPGIHQKCRDRVPLKVKVLQLPLTVP